MSSAFNMFAVICCLQSKGKRISSRKHDDFVGFRSIRSSTTYSGRWRQTRWPKLHTETEYESQLTAIRWNRNIKKSWWQEKKEISDRYMAYLSTQETSAVELNSSSRDGKKEDRKEEVTEVSMKLCLVFVCHDVILQTY